MACYVSPICKIRPIVYNTILLDGTLWQYLADIDQTCNERMELIVRQMAQRGVT